MWFKYEELRIGRDGYRPKCSKKVSSTRRALSSLDVRNIGVLGPLGCTNIYQSYQFFSIPDTRRSKQPKLKSESAR